MSDIVPGTKARMRIVRRFACYNVGDIVAVPIEQGVDLANKGLARPLDLLVPTPVAAAEPAEAPPASAPQRQGVPIRR